ncbi:uncharacterized protein LOC129583695 [Paramacrobiotus metropolitanus]|uniref:uncharacterized protein LOC129583695 n=1 Tax=Paramacrobiotus metropolitanus TaxID=2943436 RepID=UPI002445E56C|nr:uncharacterized protein LOC129583695 [Paramacrobiotus metropolitanus]
MYGPLFFFVIYLTFHCARSGIIDRFQDSQDAATLPLIEGYFRIEVHIKRLENNRGISHTGLPCDITDTCDTQFTGIIDTEKPNHDFGGDSAPYRNWEALFQGSNVNSPDINKVLVKDNCGKGIRKAHVRLRAIDKDTVNDDKIDNFSYYITGNGPNGMPAETKQSARWSEELWAKGLDKPEIKVSLRYRWYKVSQADCHPVKTSGIPFIDGMFS